MKETKKMHQMLKENFAAAIKPVAFYVGKQHLLQLMDGGLVPH